MWFYVSFSLCNQVGRTTFKVSSDLPPTTTVSCCKFLYDLKSFSIKFCWMSFRIEYKFLYGDWKDQKQVKDKELLNTFVASIWLVVYIRLLNHRVSIVGLTVNSFPSIFLSWLWCFLSRFATLLHQCLNSIKRGSAKERASAAHVIGDHLTLLVGAFAHDVQFRALFKRFVFFCQDCWLWPLALGRKRKKY